MFKKNGEKSIKLKLLTSFWWTLRKNTNLLARGEKQNPSRAGGRGTVVTGLLYYTPF
jgi:hypothetical protein